MLLVWTGNTCPHYKTKEMPLLWRIIMTRKEFIEEGWEKLPSMLNNIDWSMFKDIIDDALANGFEVKILNGTIYYREKQ